MAKSVLVIEDDPGMRAFLAGVLREEGYRVAAAAEGKEGLALLEREGWDLVFTDLRMPGMDGLAVLQEGRRVRPEARWVVITAHGSIGSAVDAMKAGAADYLTKPLRSPDELRLVARRVLREAEAEARITMLAEELGRSFPPLEMIFGGARMQEVRRLVQEVAPTDATVLITGPSGTGKELVARVLHEWSPRKGAAFIPVHCAALAESVLESELFGHERGAFTGAVAARRGRFELADGGTLLLDEVGEIPPAVQVKLLRVLQEREVERVGGARPIPVDVRVLAATNRDLKSLAAEGRFREDLYYRLNVFPIRLPPLAERRDAIPPLAAYFLARFSRQFGRPAGRFTPAAERALLEYPWPGNVRELQNVVERAVILARGEISHAQLNLEPAPGAPGEGGLLRQAERDLVAQALREEGGNRRRAAARLGISLRTLQYRIKEYGLP